MGEYSRLLYTSNRESAIASNVPFREASSTTQLSYDRHMPALLYLTAEPFSYLTAGRHSAAVVVPLVFSSRLHNNVPTATRPNSSVSAMCWRCSKGRMKKHGGHAGCSVVGFLAPYRSLFSFFLSFPLSTRASISKKTPLSIGARSLGGLRVCVGSDCRPKR